MRFLLLMGMLCLLCLALPGMAKDISSVKAELQKFLEDEDIPGIHYMVLNKSGIVFEYTGGYQNLQQKVLVSPETSFMLNSITKVFTAAAIMQLVDSGKIKLTDKLDQYFSDHSYGEDITIQHLLNQTSGIPNPLPIKWLHLEKDHRRFDENAALRSVLQEEAELSFTPGEKYAYSNISYWLLGKVIEKVAGTPYCQYLAQSIFKPLEINSGDLGCNLPNKKHYAIGYQNKYSLLSLFFFIMDVDRFYKKTDEKYFRFQRLYHNGPAYGGLNGSAQAVAKFLQDLLQDNSLLLSKKTKELFFTQQTDSSGDLIPMTLGWKVGGIDTLLFYEKPGGGPGSHGNVRIYPEKNMASLFFVNLTNVSESSISEFTSKLDVNFLE